MQIAADDVRVLRALSWVELPGNINIHAGTRESWHDWERRIASNRGVVRADPTAVIPLQRYYERADGISPKIEGKNVEDEYILDGNSKDKNIEEMAQLTFDVLRALAYVIIQSTNNREKAGRKTSVDRVELVVANPSGLLSDAFGGRGWALTNLYGLRDRVTRRRPYGSYPAFLRFRYRPSCASSRKYGYQVHVVPDVKNTRLIAYMSTQTFDVKAPSSFAALRDFLETLPRTRRTVVNISSSISSSFSVCSDGKRTNDDDRWNVVDASVMGAYLTALRNEGILGNDARSSATKSEPRCISMNLEVDSINRSDNVSDMLRKTLEYVP